VDRASAGDEIMLKLLNCPQGHFWESMGGEEGGPLPPCPECGSPAETLPLFDLLPEDAVTSREGAETSQDRQTAVTVIDNEEHLSLRDEMGFPRVAGFEIQAELEPGPTGVRHYLARQILVGRNVLLQVVLAHEDPGQTAWGTLRAEAHALGKFQHANLQAIYEAGERNRRLFYNVLEYISGSTLLEQLGGVPLPPREASTLLELLARAVSHAHEKGIIHRNLKPSRVVLEPIESVPAGKTPRQGAVSPSDPSCCLVHGVPVLPRVTGYGLARRAQAGDVIDQELFEGELGFLTPEQVWGRARDLGEATDIHGLGGILFFVLTGKPPYRGPDTSDILDAIQSGPVPRLSREQASFSSDLEAVCQKCLAKNPRRRYASARELAEDLHRLSLGLPLQGGPSSASQRLGKWVRRQPGWASFLVLLLLVGLALPITYLVGRSETLSLRRQVWLAYSRADQAEVEARQLREELNQFQLKEREAEYRTLIARIRDAYARGNLGLAHQLLEQCPEDVRGWEWYYLDQKSYSRKVIEFGPFSGPVLDLTFSQDGGRLAIAVTRTLALPGDRSRQLGEVHVYNTLDQFKPFVHRGLSGQLSAIALNHDGTRLATVESRTPDADQVRVWFTGIEGDAGVPPHPPAEGGQNPRMTCLLSRKVTGLSYPGDGRGLIVAEENGYLRRIDEFSGRTTIPFRHQLWGSQDVRLAVSPDASRLATLTRPFNRLEIWQAAGGRATHAITTPAAETLAFVGNEFLALGRSNGRIDLYDLSRSGWAQLQVTRVIQAHQAAVEQLAATPDGRRLASAGKGEGTIKVWDSQSGELLETLTGFAGDPPRFCFHSRNHALAIAANNKVVILGNMNQ
jgi:serine/threonine protein kinase/WD40 repeat protein